MTTIDYNKVDFGVFLPITNGGWIISENTPKLDGGYEINKKAALIAEELGLDFIMSMAKWKGYGGSTNHWGTSLESMTMMAGLAEATSRVKIYATVHTLLYNPAVAAKMYATLDQISGGRVGMNVVSGSFAGEFQQMGMWPEHLGHSERYDLAKEWMQVVKRLWNEDSVTHHGQYFNIEECESLPKPIQRPRPEIICAGQSEKGMGFTIDEGDACFIGGRDLEELASVSKRAKEMAAERNKTIKTYAMFTIIPGETDAHAEERMKLYQEGADEGAIKGMLRSYGLDPDGRENSMVARAKSAFMTETISGSVETITNRIEEIIEATNIDGMMLTFPDYVEDLKTFGSDILPQLRGTMVTQ
ncbi:MAG: LLM class flavin-dependent oxidoreductase [Candidatus Pristimantibacillus lignocellulolyticus]|uniref:LLM class flavin-dependent oxidoreductase n=1 Tax=Candidatus Pristimantibacillus lignocellulolyticus TaxID=2994561 RepID=A0A9J6ZGR6_9BACL|nr:MAG: LLM class flavin-dependent oxidoreductase [Candidatus Pristimantibacillus lignocellulolyticus]